MADILNVGKSLNNNFIFLQVRGQNQLMKEFNEIENIEDKLIDQVAVHRNEITLEIEGKTGDDSFFKKEQKKAK